MKKGILLPIFFWLIVSPAAFAQQGIQLQYEPEFSYSRDIFNRWEYNVKLAVRNNFAEPSAEATSRTYQIDYTQAQLFVSYDLWTTIKLSGGYGFRFNDLLEEEIGHEHRLMEQLTFLTLLEGVRVAHRIRTEQRIMAEGYTNRWRYRASYEAPLNGLRVDPGEKYLILSNEVLFSFNSKDRSGENRLYAGIGWFFNKARKLETGVQYRLGEIGTGELENTLWFTTSYYLSP